MHDKWDQVSLECSIVRETGSAFWQSSNCVLAPCFPMLLPCFNMQASPYPDSY